MNRLGITAETPDTIGPCHLIMTNVSPFVTLKPWQEQVRRTPEACDALINGYAKHHLEDLFDRLGESVDLWMGHSAIAGTQWVWPAFADLVERYRIREGEIALIECKLGSNPEIRREIIGQILAYSAGLAGMTYEDFDHSFSDRFKGVALADAVRAALAENDAQLWDEETFRQRVAENLKAGRFTLVIAVDRITDELKIVVPYINNHTVDDVRFLALEMRYVSDGDLEIVLPSVYGEESASEKQRQHRRNAWPVEAYFESLQGYSEPVQEAVKALVGFSDRRGGELAGGTGSDPSLNVRFHLNGGGKKTVWSSYYYVAGPTLDVNFEYLRDVVSMEALKESARILRSIDGAADRYVKLDDDFSSRPSLPIDGVMTKPGAIETAQEALSILLNGAVTT